MLQDNLLNPRPAWLPDAFKALARHQFLTALQVAARFGEKVAGVAAVLHGLAIEGLLHELHPTQTLRGEAPLPAYALTRRGLELLRQTSDETSTHCPNPRKSLYMLSHELLRNTFALTLEALHARGQFRLLRWETARTRLADVAQLNERGRTVRVPLVADGLAVVEVGGVATGLLVEIDMGTVSVERMKSKYQGYDAWWREGGPVRRFGLRSFRVLTVAPTETRLARLRGAALDATGQRGSRFLWFVHESDVTPEKPEQLLGPVWQVAGSDDRAQLFAEVVPKAA